LTRGPFSSPEAGPSIRPVALEELDSSSELEQSGFWGRYKALFGQRPFAFRVGERGGLLVLVRRVAPGVSLGYAPYGPDVADPAESGASREGYLLAIGEALRDELPRDVAFVRFDLPWGAEGREPPPLAHSGPLRRPGVEVQPAHTVILDLGRSDAELLAAMHHKTRYNVGLAERRGVEVVGSTDPADLATWYAIKVDNDRRDGIVTHSRRYFEALMATARERGPELRLLLARVEGRTVGGVIVSFCGKAARYLHGASADEMRHTMFSYALQWRAIRLARELGCTSYDLYGIPPDDDPAHPMHGLYRFKTGFGGTVVHRLGCYDVALRRAVYAALRLPERARYVYYKRLRRVALRLRKGSGRGERAPSP
jgi:lipid II:glycine glycyltransferase (peptidoglycan interpeptide bridge formation enzyme)